MGARSKTYAAYQSVPDALLIVGRDGSVVFANQHAEHLFGYEPDQLVGVEIEALIPERYRQQHVEMRAEFSADPTVRPMGYGRELLARKNDGREFPVEICIGPAAQEGKIVAVVREISEQQRTRRELERAIAELERAKDRLKAEAEYLREDLDREQQATEIIGASSAMVATLEKVEQAAKTDATVLLLGETGTGKELLARALHSRSNRTKMPLVKIDCATLPSGLIESELFGHERGAFTGAHETKLGRFELADGSGTTLRIAKTCWGSDSTGADPQIRRSRRGSTINTRSRCSTGSSSRKASRSHPTSSSSSTPHSIRTTTRSSSREYACAWPSNPDLRNEGATHAYRQLCIKRTHDDSRLFDTTRA